MKKINKIILLSIFILFVGCTPNIQSDLQFAYSIDKEGVYIYSLKDRTAKLIYSTDKMFLNDKFIFLNDSILQVGHQSKLRREKRERKVYSKYSYSANGDSSLVTDNPPYTTEDEYIFLTDSIFNINIINAKNYLAKIINYEHYQMTTLKINTTEFDFDGKIKAEKNTTFACNGMSNSEKEIKFCDSIRFYSVSETVLGKTITSKRGNLMLKEENKETILLKFDGNFDPKFGSGYFSPTLSSDAKKVVFKYAAGFLSSGSCIYEMDLETKTKNKIIKGNYFNPIYSPDNKLILLSTNNKHTKNDTWISDIYVMDISTKQKTKVGQAENYLWIPKR